MGFQGTSETSYFVMIFAPWVEPRMRFSVGGLTANTGPGVLSLRTQISILYFYCDIPRINGSVYTFKAFVDTFTETLILCSSVQDGPRGEDNSMASVSITEDGSFILAGSTDGDWGTVSSGGHDFAAVKLDADGNELWRWQVREDFLEGLADIRSRTSY